MKDQLEPIGPKCVIEPIIITETSSGIDRADQGHSTPVRGTVIAAGKGRMFRKGSQFKAGDVLFFRRYSVDELKFPMADGNEASVFIVEDSDIVARVINKQ